MDNFIEYRDIISVDIPNSIAFDNIVGTFNKNKYKITLHDNEKYYNKKGIEFPFFIFGTFYISELIVDKDKENVILECNDLTYRFDALYDNSCCSFPCTVKEWLESICKKVNVELEITEFPNMNKVLSEQPYLDIKSSYRNAIQVIASSSNSWVCIENDKLVLKWFDEFEEPINIVDWFTLEQQEETNPVNVVVLGRGDVEDNIRYPNIAPDTPSEWRIDNNPILDLNREELIIPIYERVKGFKYIPLKMETIGVNVRVGQKIRYNDKYGNLYETFIMTNNLTFNGGNPNDINSYTSKLENIQLKESKTKYDYSGTIQSRLTKAEINVKKQQGEIELLVEEVKQSGIPRYDNQPLDPKEEDIYLNTVDNIIYIFKDGQWIATSIDPSTLEDYWTKEEASSKIEQTSENINLSVAKNSEDINIVKRELTNIKQTSQSIEFNLSRVGGLNILPNSSFQNKLNGWKETLHKPYIEGPIIPSGITPFWYNTKQQTLPNGDVITVGMKQAYQSPSGDIKWLESDYTREQVIHIFQKQYISNVIEVDNNLSNYGINIFSHAFAIDGILSPINASVIHEPFKINNNIEKLYLSIKGFGKLDYGNILIKILFMNGNYTKYGTDYLSYDDYTNHIVDSWDMLVNKLEIDHEKFEKIVYLPDVNYDEITIQISLIDEDVGLYPVNSKEKWHPTDSEENILAIFDEADMELCDVYRAMFKEVTSSYIESVEEPTVLSEELLWYDVQSFQLKQYKYILDNFPDPPTGRWVNTGYSLEDIKNGLKIKIFDRWKFTGKQALKGSINRKIPFEGTVNLYEIMLSKDDLEWQPSSGENFWGKNIKFSGDTGIYIENTESGYSRIISEKEDTAKNSAGNITWTLTTNGILVQDQEVKGVIKHGNIIEVAREDGNYGYYV